MSAFIKQIRKISANLKKSISLKLCTLVEQLVLRVGFLKYRVIIGKYANFDDATEAAILTLNFNPTSADSHRQTMHSIALKPWSNGHASSRKLITWGYLRLRLARPCVHLRWLAITLVQIKFARKSLLVFYRLATQPKSTRVQWLSP